MTDREIMQMALDALNNFDKGNHGMRWQVPVIKALRARLAQPEPWVKTYSGGKPNYTESCERCGEVNPAEIHTCTPKQREMNKDEYIKFLESACRDIYEVWAGSEGIPMPETAPEGYLLFLVEQMRDIAKRALAQPEQEPVGNTLTFMTRAIFNIVADHQEINGGYFIADGDVAAFVDRLAKIINSTFEPLKHKNTAPPQREWQGLTDDEIDDIWAKFNDGYSIIEETLWGYERAIEAKIREKNA